MLVKTIKYTDFNGTERTEDCYFHLTQSEVMEMEMGTSGGYSQMINRIIAAQDMPTIMAEFKRIILMSYGQKSPDGRRFIKSTELSKEFSETEAYSKLFMELITSPEEAAAFVKAIMPSDMSNVEMKTNNVVPMPAIEKTTE